MIHTIENKTTKTQTQFANTVDQRTIDRMRRQNRFKTGLDIARYNAKIMRRDMACLLYTSPSPRD